MPSNARAALIWNDVITRPVHTRRMINDASYADNDVKNITWQAEAWPGTPAGRGSRRTDFLLIEW
jgi:hypothetical protein